MRGVRVVLRPATWVVWSKPGSRPIQSADFVAAAGVLSEPDEPLDDESLDAVVELSLVVDEVLDELVDDEVFEPDRASFL